ncbi:hypothetical protein PGT21_018747 [Puccinia graminis f. sp. tritici]|uniref:Uncharacterized protein n=1 Tax=Puccinia graminis f. sp. tritici TaxID=56615 RepID=A0A5B0P875_PUCGR|nr:hypothetical protein PGT21_018747 [Puccinia graminis f. sp. tritici]KAA1126027.1 hypothetical protein PGTUg99_013853 [Puccinia graminis f. sp. tritici]
MSTVSEISLRETILGKRFAVHNSQSLTNPYNIKETQLMYIHLSGPAASKLI